jgi:hypothetical protein
MIENPYKHRDDTLEMYTFAVLVFTHSKLEFPYVAIGHSRTPRYPNIVSLVAESEIIACIKLINDGWTVVKLLSIGTHYD